MDYAGFRRLMIQRPKKVGLSAFYVRDAQLHVGMRLITEYLPEPLNILY